jgi:hypothetical protein
MVHHLLAATKVAGLAYRLLATTTMIGFLVFGIIEAIRHKR